MAKTAEAATVFTRAGPTAAIGQVKRVLVVFSLYLCWFQLPVASSRVRPLLKTKGLFVP